MNRLRIRFMVVATTALVPTVTHAGTIIKLGFSTDSRPDIVMEAGILSTSDDAFGATNGDQNTEVTFLDGLAGALPIAIEGDRASFTLADVAIADTPPAVIGTTILQHTQGGSFALYDPSDEVLLSGTLGDGTLSGPIGGTATGGFLTTEFGSFTGGTLLPILTEAGLVNSSLSISLTDVNTGDGLSIGEDGRLNSFSADATANIGAQVPEPLNFTLALLGSLALSVLRQRN